MTQREKHCSYCGGVFEARHAMHRYCSSACKQRAARREKGLVMAKGRHCRNCGTLFFPDFQTQKARWYCTPECAKQGARESRAKYYEQRPEKVAQYRAATKSRIVDNNMRRFRIRFPDAPEACESCGEDRVLDIAHKPGFERQGAWRSKANTTWPDKVWVLCPTCHALIDRKGYDPSTLGLS